jgi:hypothetical protein
MLIAPEPFDLAYFLLFLHPVELRRKRRTRNGRKEGEGRGGREEESLITLYICGKLSSSYRKIKRQFLFHVS